jgi:hypothetical protein
MDWPYYVLIVLVGFGVILTIPIAIMFGLIMSKGNELMQADREDPEDDRDAEPRRGAERAPAPKAGKE